MKIPLNVIDGQPRLVKDMFLKWCKYMEDNVTFGLYDSDVHTKGHCERVLMYALILVNRIFGDSEEEHQILSHASIFHDTRRQDDYLDKGHGARAALYYKEYCNENGLTFYPLAYDIMSFHDQDDKLGIETIKSKYGDDGERCVRLYQIFKDADALDRFRLGPWGLNKRFLRNGDSVELMDFARNLVEVTVEPDMLRKTMELTSRFKDRLQEGR